METDIALVGTCGGRRDLEFSLTPTWRKPTASTRNWLENIFDEISGTFLSAELDAAAGR